MTEFSKKLTLIISEYCTSVQSAARRLGIERPNLHKYMCGSRIPTSLEFVEKLASVLMLSTSERKELIELYKIEKMGDSVYKRRVAIRDILINAANSDFIKTTPIKNHYSHDFQETSECFPLYGINNVKNMVRALMEREATLDNGSIKMVTHPTNDFIISVIQSILIDTNVKIEHIFCMEKTIREDHDNLYNLDCFKSIFPLLYFSESYTPMYYYDTIANQINLMQYMIILSDCVIGFSADYQFAVIYRSNGYVEFMNKLYDSVKRISRKMLTPLLSTIDHIKLYTDNFEKGNNVVNILEPEPCFGTYFTDDLIESKILIKIPRRKEIVSAAQQMYALHQNQFKAKTPPVTIFSSEGLDIFAKTGRIAEIPPEIYKPFTIEERIELMQKLVASMNEKLPHAFILDSSKFKLPNNIIISAYQDQTVQIVLINSDMKPISLVINESSINFAICDYLTYLESSHYCYAKIDAVNIVNNKITELKKHAKLSSSNSKFIALDKKRLITKV